MVIVTAAPKPAGPQVTVDMTVGAANSSDYTDHNYRIAPSNSNQTDLVTHNSVSLLAGSSPGVHYPLARHYIRRVRVPKDNYLVAVFKAAGYHVEPCQSNPNVTSIISFPVALGEGVRTTSEVSMMEKLEVTAILQRYWSDNQVSVTVDFSPAEGAQIANALSLYEDRLKSVSFLPRGDDDNSSYAQMPYEKITEAEYHRLSAKLKPVQTDLQKTKADDVNLEVFCDGDQCVKL